MKLIAVLLAAMMCAACAPKNIDAPTTAAQTETTTKAQTTTQTTTAAEETTVAPAPTPGPSLVDARQPLDEAGVLWEIENERISEGQQELLQSFGGDFLLSGNGLGDDGAMVYRMAVLSGADGSVLAQTELAGLSIAEAHICGEKIAVTDLMSGTVILLDGQLQQLSRFSTGTEFASLYVDPAGEHVYIFVAQEGLKKVNLASGEKEVLVEGADLFPSVRNGDTVTFAYVDRASQKNMHAMVNLASGQVETLPFAGSFFTTECDAGLWLAGRMNEDGIYYIGTSQARIFTAPEANTMVSLLSGPSRLLCSSFDESGKPTLKLYGTDGSFLSGCTLTQEEAFLMQDPLWLEEEGGYLFPVTDSEGVDHLIFWDLSAPVQGQNVTLKPVQDGQAVQGSAVSQALYERAAAIGAKYGVTVAIADQCRTEFGDHAAQSSSDEALIAEALDTVELALSRYPEGFLQQLLCGNMQSLELHLTGTIRRTDQNEGDEGFTGFVGCAQIEESYAAVAVDIAQPWSTEKTLYHEIMHVINHRLSFDANLRAEAKYSEEAWNALNPEGFTYAERLTDLPADFNQGGWEAWFVDDYSRTYGKEDRARIMEYAMVGDVFMFKSAQGRQQKLAYLCECIRDCFDTTGWPEKTRWEETLEKSGR